MNTRKTMITEEFETLEDLTQWMLRNEHNIFAVKVSMQGDGDKWFIEAHGTFE